MKKDKFQKLVGLVETCNLNPADSICTSFSAATGRSNLVLGLARLAASPGITIPGLSIAPDDWMLPVVLTNTGNPAFGFFGPGGIAFDPEGNLYICENLQFGTTTECAGMACPGLYIVWGFLSCVRCLFVLQKNSQPILEPDGDPLAISPFFGSQLGAINGTGFGMSINRKTLDLWAASFQDLSPAAFVGQGDPNAGFITHFGSAAQSRPLIKIYKNASCAGIQGFFFFFFFFFWSMKKSCLIIAIDWAFYFFFLKRDCKDWSFLIFSRIEL